MSNSVISGAQLKGVTRRLVDKNGNVRDMSFDFNAQCVIEETMREYGLAPEDEQARILKEAADEAQAKAEGVPYTPPTPRGPGFYRTMGIFAFALTSSWREDNGEEGMSFKEFRRLLPGGLDGAGNWIGAVTAVMAPESDQEPAPAPVTEGNESPAPEGQEASNPTEGSASESSSQQTGGSCGGPAEQNSESPPPATSGA